MKQINTRFFGFIFICLQNNLLIYTAFRLKGMLLGTQDTRSTLKARISSVDDRDFPET